MSGWKCAQQLAAHADMPEKKTTTADPTPPLRALLQIVILIVLNQSAPKRNGVVWK